MLMFNLVGTYKGDSVLCMRTTDDTSTQSVSVIKGRPNNVYFVSNGDTVSFTQTVSVVNEEQTDEEAIMKVENTVWSQHGRLMTVTDNRLQFLRFSQRDSILFSAVTNEKRALVEVQLKPNKFVFRTYSEMDFCSAIAADARQKYLWAITTNNEMEVHNVWDKEFRRLTVPDGYEFKSVVILNESGRSAVAILEHSRKHHISVAHLELTDSELKLNNIQTVGAPNMQMQPGSLVQGRGCLLFTLKNTEQQQQLVTVASYNNSLFCATHNIRVTLSQGDVLQRVLFTDILIDDYELVLGMVANRNMYSCWKFNMRTSQLTTSKLLYFPTEMQDLIIDRVVLMKARQEELEKTSDVTKNVLVSAHVTDMITARMRQQIEVVTNTARATVSLNRNTTEKEDSARQFKEIIALREANDMSQKKMLADHAVIVKRLNSEHAAKLLQLEEKLSAMQADRDQRISSKQHDTLKAISARDKQTIRVQEKALDDAKIELSRLHEKFEIDIKTWQQRVLAAQAERDSLRREKEFVQETCQRLQAKCKAVEISKTDEVSSLQKLVQALEVENNKAKQKFEEMSSLIQNKDSEKLLLNTQLAELRAHVNDNDLLKKLQQLTLQTEASQSRSRHQFETLQREIDSLRRANYSLSQSYHMLTTVTNFGFLPDGTSLETGVQMMRNLTVFQQDLAVAREENFILRKRVQDLEGKVESN